MGAREHFERGRRLMAEGQPFDALAHIERAHQLSPHDAEYTSYYALLHALERGQVSEAIGLAWEAIDRDPRPDFYHNLGRIYLKGNQKAEAIEVLRAGLERDPSHAGIQDTLRALGVRRPPVFPSLPRSHLLNRLFGKLRAQLLPS